jgi:putative ABC transport system permease protein
MPNLAKANLLARKTRSVVTIFGVAISVALMVILAGMANGTIRDIVNRIMSIGADIMVGGDEMGIFYPSGIISEKVRGKLTEVDGIERATPVLIESAPQVNESKQFNYIYGIDYQDYIRLGEGFNFVDGRELRDPSDIIIDEEVATANQISVGDRLTVLNHDWNVVGIVKEALGARYYVDRKALAAVAHPGRSGGICTVLYVTVRQGMDVEVVSRAVRDNLGSGYSVRNVEELFEAFFEGALPLREFMIAQFAVSAIICFSVILLSMYNAIIERTREIGILKSLGATRGFIIGQILKEALVIVVFGIVVGYVLGSLGLTMITNSFSLLKAEISVELLIYSAVIAICATLLGTLYPALRASRLDPVEALSWE